MRDIIYIRLHMFSSNDICFALFMDQSCYIFIERYLSEIRITQPIINVQLSGQLIQTTILFDIRQALA